MTDADFAAACAAVRTGSFGVDDDTKLRLYALYKIATVGAPPRACNKKEFLSRAKLSAWRDLYDTVSRAEDAKAMYALEVALLTRP